MISDSHTFGQVLVMNGDRNKDSTLDSTSTQDTVYTSILNTTTAHNNCIGINRDFVFGSSSLLEKKQMGDHCEDDVEDEGNDEGNNRELEKKRKGTYHKEADRHSVNQQVSESKPSILNQSKVISMNHGDFVRLKKIRKTCINCARSKVKCSSTFPSCERCSSHGWDCGYAEARKRGRKNHLYKLSENNAAVYMNGNSINIDNNSMAMVDYGSRAISQNSLDPFMTDQVIGTSPLSYNDNTSGVSHVSSLSTNDLLLNSSNKIPGSANINGIKRITINHHLYLILKKTELKVERMFLLLFKHVSNSSNPCACNNSPDLYTTSSYQLPLNRFFEFNKFVNRSKELDDDMVSSDHHERDFHYLSSSRTGFIQFFDVIPKDYYVYSPGPSLDQCFRVLKSGCFESFETSTSTFGNTNFTRNKTHALTMNVPTIKINYNVTSDVSVTINHQFSSLMEYSQEEINLIISSSLFPGLLPFGADVLSIFVSSDDDLLAYIHQTAINFRQNSLLSSTFIREGWSESIYRFHTKNGTQVCCLLRSIIRELVTVSGSASEIYFQFLPNNRTNPFQSASLPLHNQPYSLSLKDGNGNPISSINSTSLETTPVSSSSSTFVISGSQTPNSSANTPTPQLPLVSNHLQSPPNEDIVQRDKNNEIARDMYSINQSSNMHIHGQLSIAIPYDTQNIPSSLDTPIFRFPNREENYSGRDAQSTLQSIDNYPIHHDYFHFQQQQQQSTLHTQQQPLLIPDSPANWIHVVGNQLQTALSKPE